MKNSYTKLVVSVILLHMSTLLVNAQNWQYVGSPYINQSVGLNDFLYFGDLEFNTSGDAFLGYWKYSQELKFAKFSGGSWTQLTSPGSYAVSNVDIEVKGNNYYFAYSGVKGANMYVFVKKYNGTGWTQLGDSLLLGNSGSGGYFEFVLDNNEVPTILGAVSVPLLGEKQIMQYNGSSWVNYLTFTGSAASIFGEASATFNSQNQLYCNTQGYITLPAFSYFTVMHKIDNGVRTTVGDTIFTNSGAHVTKLDSQEIPYLCFSQTAPSEVMAYKLNGANWNFIADTSGAIGGMLAADVAGNGKVVFNTQFSNLNKSVFIYDNGTRLNMDTIAVQGFGIGAIHDLVIAPGSNDVYALILEIKTGGAQDYSVMKHAIAGTNAVEESNKDFNVRIFPNPSNGHFIIQQQNFSQGCKIEILNIQGQTVYSDVLNKQNYLVDLSKQAHGMYVVKIYNDTYQSIHKIMSN